MDLGNGLSVSEKKLKELQEMPKKKALEWLTATKRFGGYPTDVSKKLLAQTYDKIKHGGVKKTLGSSNEGKNK